MDLGEKDATGSASPGRGESARALSLPPSRNRIESGGPSGVASSLSLSTRACSLARPPAGWGQQRPVAGPRGALPETEPRLGGNGKIEMLQEKMLQENRGWSHAQESATLQQFYGVQVQKCYTHEAKLAH